VASQSLAMPVVFRFLGILAASCAAQNVTLLIIFFCVVLSAGQWCLCARHHPTWGPLGLLKVSELKC
jgi:hypothetical protein